MEKNYNICAMRGRSEGDWHHSLHRQRLELGGGIANSITTVTKDNLVIETYDEDNVL